MMTILRTALWGSLLTAVSVAPTLAADKDLDLKKFSKVKIYAPVDVDVVVGKSQSFTLQGRDEDLAKIIVKVKGDTLIIKKEKRSGRLKAVKAKVTVKALTDYTIYGSSDGAIHDLNNKTFDLVINGSGDVVLDGKSDELNMKINGSGDVSSQGFEATGISTKINGSGDISMTGTCKNIDVSISGSGDFEGRKMVCGEANVSVSGSGDVTVHASEAVNVRTSGSSDVDVYGKPKSVKHKSSGSSDFTVHDE